MTKKQQDNTQAEQPVASAQETQQPQVAPEQQSQPAQGASSLLVTIMVLLMRVVVGGVFVMSGFVKAIDPWGSYYKFNEYLLAMGWDSLISLTLFGAFALAIFEFVLGVLLVTGSCRRGAPLLAIAMMIVLTPITLWLAVTNAVPDCGCFGDFLVLSNWATFGKNVVLLAGLVYLLFLNRQVPSLYGPAVQWMVIFLSFAFAMLIAFFGYFTQPLIDFRPFKVGTHLVTNATSTTDDDYVFVYEKDGVEQEFSIDSVPDDDSGWNFVTRKTVSEATAPAAKDGLTIAAWDNGDDVSDELLASDNLLLLLLPDMDKVSVAYTFRINDLQEYASQHGAVFAALTSASEQDIEQWVDISMAHYPLYNADDSEIKMIARGNPAVVYVSEGNIVWKRTLNSIDPDSLHNPELTLATMNDDYDASDTLYTLVWVYILSLVAVLIVNRTHVVARLAFTKRGK